MNIHKKFLMFGLLSWFAYFCYAITSSQDSKESDSVLRQGDFEHDLVQKPRSCSVTEFKMGSKTQSYGDDLNKLDDESKWHKPLSELFLLERYHNASIIEVPVGSSSAKIAVIPLIEDHDGDPIIGKHATLIEVPVDSRDQTKKMKMGFIPIFDGTDQDKKAVDEKS